MPAEKHHVSGKEFSDPELISLPDKPLVSIVTTVYNGEKYIEDTIQSVLSQTYDKIEYIIIDGGSTDRTVEIIRKYEDKITYWISEPDKGMYDGLCKGFEIAHGEILAWLNADDMYYPSAIQVVVEYFLKYPSLEWITGVGTFYDSRGLITRVSIPTHYFRCLMSRGLYRDDLLGCIQQESTFWRRTLWDKAGGLNCNLKLAGDYELWVKFSQYAPIFQIPTILGGIRQHELQKSCEIHKYNSECDHIRKRHLFCLWLLLVPLIKFSGVLVAIYKLHKGQEIL